MIRKKIILTMLALLSLTALVFGYGYRAHAESGFFGSNCQGCHSVSTCNGCHAHGAHPTSSKSSLNITATTNKTSYQPGETVSVTITGGYRSGWVRAILYNGDPASGGVEIARSTGPSGMGGGSGFPITLKGTAPAAPGTYTFSASWYGNKYDKSGAFFGPKWRPDPNNPNHGEEIVATNSFTVVSATPPPAPAITVTDSVTPATDLLVPFGSVTSGSSATQTVTVKNTGTANLSVGAVNSANPLAAPFAIKTDTCSNQTIAPSASCTITLTFSPAATGAFTDSFAIPSNDPAKSTVTVNVSGTGAAAPVPAITVTDSVSPTTDLLVPFGSITSGSSAAQTVTVRNTGTADLIIGGVGSANPLASPFSIRTDTCSNQMIAPAASCTITAAFAPAATGAFADSFSIPSNDPAKSTVTVNVSGTGAAAPVPALSVTDSVTPNNDLLVPFGSVNTGSSITHTVTVKNTGTANLAIGAVGSTDSLAAPFSVKTDACSNQTLVPAASCTVTVAFAPASTGTFADSFNIPSSDPAKSTVTVNVSGSGTSAAVADITVTDSTAPTTDLKVDFGSVLAGTSREQTVTVKNDGNADLVLGSTGSGNTLAAPFTISADTCAGKTIVPAASCTITVRFTPSATGPFTDSFLIPSNDPDEASVVVSVNGQGQAVPVPDITISDSVAPTSDLQVPFGTILAGSSTEQTLTIRNDGNADLVPGTLGSASPLEAPFTIKTDTCSGMTIAPAGSCSVTIEFAPATVGNFADSINIPSNDPDEPSVTVALSGIGGSTSVGDIRVTDSVAPIEDLRVPFGYVRGGRTSNKTVIVSNSADGQLTIGTIGSTNGLASPFSIAADACSNRTLAAGQNCSVTVRFTAPADCSRTAETRSDDDDDDDDDAGRIRRCFYSDSFDIPSDDPDEQPVTIQVNGLSVLSSGNIPPDRPRHRYPADGQRDLEKSFRVRWEAAADADGDAVTYEVRISRDREFRSLVTSAGSSSAPAGKTTGMMYAGSGLGFLFFGVAFIGTARGRKGLLAIAAVLILAGTTFVACSSSDNNVPQASSEELTQQVDGLQSGATYYWKVIASDGNGGVTESDVTGFTTK